MESPAALATGLSSLYFYFSDSGEMFGQVFEGIASAGLEVTGTGSPSDDDQLLTVEDLPDLPAGVVRPRGRWGRA